MEQEVTRVRNERPQTPAVEAESGLANYRLGACLGAGLLSEVFEGFNLVAQKPCAIKLFRREAAISPAAFGRFVHEAGLLARLGHPSLADVYLSGKTDSRFFAVLERVPGTDLRTLLGQHAPLARRVYLPVLRGLCNALAALHAHDIAHCHLHAGQVMVIGKDPALEVKLLDCGTHHVLPHLQEQPAGWQWRPEDAICVAPEQAKGNPGDSHSDVYALAVLLYEMVTGRVPFLASTFATTLEQHVNEAPRPPSELVEMPSELEELILRGLEKDPRKRIPSVEAFLAGLDPLSITGQFQLPGSARKSAGRQKVLTAVSSQELQLADVETDAASRLPAEEAPSETRVARPTARALPLRARGNRRWLFPLLAGVALGCGIAVTLLLIDSEDSEPAPTGEQPAAAGAASSSGAVPGARRRQRKVRSPAPAPAGPTALLEVRTGSSAALVFVDGSQRGQGFRVILPQIPAGSHRVYVERDGQQTPAREIQLAPNQRLTLDF